METKCTENRKDYYQLIIKGNDLGEFEKSELRQIIELIDNQI